MDRRTGEIARKEMVGNWNVEKGLGGNKRRKWTVVKRTAGNVLWGNEPEMWGLYGDYTLPSCTVLCSKIRVSDKA